MEIPTEIKQILEILQKNGFEAFIVGGCVRDLLTGISPHDWDITTNATPKKIEACFDAAKYQTFYENDFGTVSVVTPAEDPALKTIEITPFRIEAKYSDQRHPDAVRFAKTLAEDLSRRDFTINALAFNEKIIDLFGGQEDLKNKVIRAVGEPAERFQEDALRLMRAGRFATTLSTDGLWQIEEKTKSAIQKNAHLLRNISQERIRDELIKIIMSPNGAKGIELLEELGLLKFVIPELEEGLDIDQSKHHTLQVYQHNISSLNYACWQNFSLEVRMAALLHDIAKPRVKKGQGEGAIFYNHEIIGAKMSQQILQRLRFSKKQNDKITKLVKYHLFYYNVDEVGSSSVRRLVRNVGPDNIEELLQVRKADRIGSGVPKAEPYKLRHLKYLVEKVAQDPIAPKMIKINGHEIMKILGISAGPKVGQVLSYLLSQVLSEPKNNTKEFLEAEVKKLGKLSDQALQKLAQQAKKDVEYVETKRDNMTKQKYWVT